MSRNPGQFSPRRLFPQLGDTGLYCKCGISAPQVKAPVRFLSHIHLVVWAKSPSSAQFFTLSWERQPCHALGVPGRHFTSAARAVLIVPKIERFQIIPKLIFTP